MRADADGGGAWTYTVNNSHAAVQALGAGQSLVESITVRALDGTTQVITITINAQ